MTHLLVCGTDTYLGPARCQVMHKGAERSPTIYGWERRGAKCYGDPGEAERLEVFRRFSERVTPGSGVSAERGGSDLGSR